MVKALRAYVFCILAMFMSFDLTAQDQTEILFEKGIVLIICAPPDGIELTTEQFNSAFPEWITVLQTRANEGIISRAHYLGELKAGVFVVVEGQDKDKAMSNALSVSAELNDIYRRTTGSEGIDTCNFREIGPVAILPQ